MVDQAYVVILDPLDEMFNFVNSSFLQRLTALITYLVRPLKPFAYNIVPAVGNMPDRNKVLALVKKIINLYLQPIYHGSAYLSTCLTDVGEGLSLEN